MCPPPSAAHSESMTNISSSATTYEIALLHGHDLTDAAERRRQTQRVERCKAGRRELAGSQPRSVA